MTKDKTFLDTVNEVITEDKIALVCARRNYGESWCKRGGVGAFMMLARKWDRLENYLNTTMKSAGKQYDILEAIEMDGRPEGIIDDIRDLRRYLILVEAKILEQKEIAEVKKDLSDNLEKLEDQINTEAVNDKVDTIETHGKPVEVLVELRTASAPYPIPGTIKGTGDFETAFQRVVSDVSTFSARLTADGCSRDVTRKMMEIHLAHIGEIFSIFGALVEYKQRGGKA